MEAHSMPGTVHPACHAKRRVLLPSLHRQGTGSLEKFQNIPGSPRGGRWQV